MESHSTRSFRGKILEIDLKIAPVRRGDSSTDSFWQTRISSARTLDLRSG